MDQLPPDSHWASASHTLPPEPPRGPKQPATPTLASTNAMIAMLRRTRAPRLGFAGGFPGAEGTNRYAREFRRPYGPRAQHAIARRQRVTCRLTSHLYLEGIATPVSAK